MSEWFVKTEAMLTLHAPVVRALRCIVLAGFVTACSSDPTDPTSTTGTDAGTSSARDCRAECTAKVTSCSVPTDPCAQVCDGSITQGQIACLSAKACGELAGVDGPEGLAKVCPKGAGDAGPAPVAKAGKVGDACKCGDATGDGPFQCGGDGSGCEATLVCGGSVGKNGGQCAGPNCCDGVDDCVAKVGKQSGCPAGLVCRAAFISSTRRGYCAK